MSFHLTVHSFALVEHIKLKLITLKVVVVMSQFLQKYKPIYKALYPSLSLV